MSEHESKRGPAFKARPRRNSDIGAILEKISCRFSRSLQYLADREREERERSEQ